MSWFVIHVCDGKVGCRWQLFMCHPFHWVGNVQKGGNVTSARNTQVVVFHGMGHMTSLLLGNVVAEKSIQ